MSDERIHSVRIVRRRDPLWLVVLLAPFGGLVVLAAMVTLTR